MLHHFFEVISPLCWCLFNDHDLLEHFLQTFGELNDRTYVEEKDVNKMTQTLFNVLNLIEQYPIEFENW